MSNIYNIDNDSLDQISTGEEVVGYPSYMLVNEHKAVKSAYKESEGLFAILVTKDEALIYQQIVDVADDYTLELLTSGEIELEFDKPLDGTINENTYSNDFISLYPPIVFGEEDTFDDVVTVVIGETRIRENDNGKVGINILESHHGSVDVDALDERKQNYYIGDIINRDSKYVKLLSNGGTTITVDNMKELIPTSIELLSFTETESIKTIDYTNVDYHINRCLEYVTNPNDYKIDFVVDAGLSTIGANSNYTNWRSIVDTYTEFCEKKRKDCVALVDAPRFLSLSGDYKRIRKTNNNTFVGTILPDIYNLIGINSSYASIYTNWIKTADVFKSNNPHIWIPSSPSVAAVGSKLRYPWDAIAGPINGIVDNVIDLSFNPTQKEADLIVSKKLNYLKTFRGSTDIQTQLTTMARNSAFSELNVRRLSLYIQRVVASTVKYYIYEGNNKQTRDKILIKLDGILKMIKMKNGLLDYEIICDETNNTDDVIDNNEIRVSIKYKPIGSVKYILIDFIGTPTDNNFNEIL